MELFLDFGASRLLLLERRMYYRVYRAEQVVAVDR